VAAELCSTSWLAEQDDPVQGKITQGGALSLYDFSLFFSLSY
jgi:hypothetical protein